MRLLFVLLVVLIGALLAEAVFHSAVGAWVAFGAVLAIVGLKVFGVAGPVAGRLARSPRWRRLTPHG